MELSTAIALIEKGVNNSKGNSWADLGAGDGLFTRALSSLLPEGSTITAVDKNRKALDSIDLTNRNVHLKRVATDFQTLALGHMDGILMANSLHFIKDQFTFLRHLKDLISPDGRLIIVEYDSDKSNTWVPFPLSFETLAEKIHDAGFKSAVKMHQVPSRFGRTNIYSACIDCLH